MVRRKLKPDCHLIPPNKKYLKVYSIGINFSQKFFKKGGGQYAAGAPSDFKNFQMVKVQSATKKAGC